MISYTIHEIGHNQKEHHWKNMHLVESQLAKHNDASPFLCCYA